MKGLKKFIKKNFIWILLFVCLIGFLSLANEVLNKEIVEGDIIGYNVISTLLVSDFTTPIAKFITNFGGATCLCTIAVVSLIFVKNKKIVLLICINLISITILNLLLKNLLQRPRPTGYRLINESGYSFPSGHAMVSMAFYGFIIYLIYKYVNNKYIKYISLIFFSVLIIFIGISRIYLGVHYTSDVIAGFLISISYLIIFIKVVNKFIIERE